MDTTTPRLTVSGLFREHPGPLRRGDEVDLASGTLRRAGAPVPLPGVADRRRAYLRVHEAVEGAVVRALADGSLAGYHLALNQEAIQRTLLEAAYLDAMREILPRGLEVDVDGGGPAARALLREAGCRVGVVRDHDGGVRTRVSVRGRRAGWDVGLKLLRRGLARPTAQGSSADSPDLMIVDELRSASVAEGLRAVDAAARRTGRTVTVGRLWNDAFVTDSPVDRLRPSVHGNRVGRGLAARRGFLPFLREIADELSLPRSTVDGWPLAGRAALASTALLLASVDAQLRRVEPRAVLVATDLHPYSRAVCLRARDRGIPTTTLLHGLPVAELGYLPVMSDVLVVWGRASEEWFLERGVAADRIRVAGAPRFAPAQRLRGVQRRRVLYAAQPSSWGRVVGDIAALAAAVGEAAATLRVRPHPAGRQRAQLEAALHALPAGLRERVELSTTVSLEEDLLESDALAHAGSTAALEALLAGIPTINLEPTRDGTDRSGPWDIARVGFDATDDPGDAVAAALDGARRATCWQGVETFLEAHLATVGDEAAARTLEICLR